MIVTVTRTELLSFFIYGYITYRIYHGVDILIGYVLGIVL